MEFTISRENILKGLSKIQSVVEKRNTMPILSNVLLKANGDHLTVSATDLEVSFSGKVTAKVKTEGSLTVSAKKLYEIVKEFPDEDIYFKKDENNWLIIKSGKINFKIVGLSADEYPVIPDDIGDEAYSIISKVVLKEMIDKTEFAISTEESRVNLCGVYIEKPTEEGLSGVNMVATDGHRLTLINRDININVEHPVIIPRKGVTEIRKIIEDTQDDTVQFKIVKNNCAVSIGTATLFVRLIDETFPNYRQVMPKGNDYKVIINRENLLKSLKRISLLSTERYKGVKFNISGGVMTVTANSAEYGEAKETMDIVEAPDKNMSIGLNAKYVMDVLNTMTEENVVMELKDESSQCVMKPHNGAGFISVIMPMRL